MTKPKNKIRKIKAKERRKVEYTVGCWLFPWQTEVVTHYIDK